MLRRSECMRAQDTILQRRVPRTCPPPRIESPSRLQHLSNDPLQRFAFATFVAGSHLRMQKHSDRANQPMLPVVTDDDCDSIYLLLVVFYKPSVILEGRNIFPAVECGGINQQSNLPMLADNRIDLRRNFVEVVSFQFLWCRNPQYVVRNNILS